MKKNKTESFIAKAKEVHGNKYDYSLSLYAGRNKSVKIICSEHGAFDQIVGNHYAGKGCRFCANNVNYTKSDFVKKAQKVHEDKYDYSRVEYINNRTNVKIICPDHGNFTQLPMRHLKGSGCKKCAYASNGLIFTNTLDEFIAKAKDVHGKKYDYSKVKYKSNKDKICIICPKHGEFNQRPDHHTGGVGCARCFGGVQLNTKEVIEDFREVHGDRFNYSEVEYVKAKNKVKIICSDHGVFKQTPNDHKQGYGCPSCNTSKGENKTKELLKERGITFKQQYTFSDCRNTLPLPFDFYLPEHNICIEYNGIQHYKPIDYFGGKKAFESQKKRDKIKSDYCKSNNIQLISIKHNECIETKIEAIASIFKNSFHKLNRLKQKRSMNGV